MGPFDRKLRAFLVVKEFNADILKSRYANQFVNYMPILMIHTIWTVTLLLRLRKDRPTSGFQNSMKRPSSYPLPRRERRSLLLLGEGEDEGFYEIKSHGDFRF